MSSRPTIEEFATWYGTSRYLMTKMLRECGTLSAPKKRGNRPRLYPIDVQAVINRFGDRITVK